MKLHLFLLSLALVATDSFACTVPVFRYALDNWPGQTNRELEDSPVLQDIANRLISGDSTVWVQIDSGNAEADDAQFARLAARLEFFASVAELPEIDPNDPSSQLGPGPKLDLKFSALRLPRSSPLTRQFAGQEFDALPADEPWIAPVFGRGRVLGIWPANLMDEEGIDEACFYLTGACSCQVKEQNPGWDLVMNVDWDTRLREIDSGPLLAETSSPPPAPEAPTEPETVTFGTAEPTQSSDQLSWFWMVLAAILGLSAGMILKNRKPKL